MAATHANPPPGLEHTIRVYTPGSPLPAQQWPTLTRFLYHQLGRFTDPAPAINTCLTYALSNEPAHGGAVFLAYNKTETQDLLVGACITNRTHMEAYIPAHILVYIAVDEAYRGHGIGRSLIAAAQAHCQGGIALHVEPDNPARHLYQALGFTQKYLEMRYEPR